MTSKFQSLYSQLREAIQAGLYPVGSKLPSENEFCAQFGVSRGTLRKALELLAEDGLIHSLHGKGVYALDPKQIDFSLSSLVSFAEAAQLNQLNFVTEVNLFKTIKADEEILRLSGFQSIQSLYQIQRTRKLDLERIILDLNYFSSDLIPRLTHEIVADSIYKHIENTLNLKIGFARRTIQVEAVNELDQQFLDLNNFNLVVVVRNWVHLQDGQLFEYTESRHRPDRFVFTEFVRRR